MSRIRFVLCTLALAAQAAGAQDAASYRHRAPIAAPEGHSHYRLSLPAVVYAGVERRDLGDLRVLNARGEPVPYAFLAREPSGPAPVHAADARLFPLYGVEAQGLDGVKLDVVRGASGTVIRLAEAPRKPGAERKLLGYLAELGKDEKPIEALELEWRTASTFSGAVRVEASDDLSHWRTLVSDAPLLALEHEGERLERRRIELRGVRGEYLRLSFVRVPGDFELRGLRLQRRGERGEPDREWTRLAAAQAGKPGEYRFEANGRFPVDRVRLALPQPNTVARVQILSREHVDQSWRSLAAATVYRLHRDGATVSSPDIAVAPSAERLWLLRADQRGGGLGAGDVALELGWIPHELVFAARGDPPFELVFGNARARPEALSIASVVPGYEPGKALEAQPAALGAVAPMRLRATLASDPVGWLREAFSSGRAKTWALWFVLGLGVLAVVWMALRLLREVGSGATGTRSGPTPPKEP